MLFNLKHPWVGVLIAVVVSVLGFWTGRNLEVKLSLADLLPDQRPSVLDLKAVSKDVGGVGYTGIIVGPVEGDPTARFGSLVQELGELPLVRYAYFERESFLLRKKALYLMPRDDFEQILESTKILLNDGKVGGFLDLGLLDSGARQQNISKATGFFEDIRRRYALGDSSVEGRRYYASEDGRYAIVWVKPSFDSESVVLSQQLVETIEAKTRQILGPGVPFHLWGRSVNNVNDSIQIKRDVAKTSWIGLSVIMFLLVGGLGGLRAALLTVLVVNISMGWVVGFAGLFVGRVNVVTSFLLAILGGLGVEYGIHLVRRFYQNKKTGISRLEALQTTYFQMSRILLSAALTSSGAFLILSFSDFRGFSEMGLIAGMGILSIYVCYLLCFPMMARLIRKEARTFLGAERFFRFYPFKARSVWILLPMLGLLIFGLSRARFEYDFQKMRQLSKKTEEMNLLVDRVNLGRSTAPAALMATDVTQARRLHRWVEERLDRHNLHSVVSVANLLPEDMEERRERLSTYRHLLDDFSDQELRSKIDLDPSLVREWVGAEPLIREELPVQLKDAFGPRQSVVLVYTKDSLGQEAGLRNFNRFLQLSKQEFPGVRAGSDVGVFVEIVDHIEHDGKIVLLLFLLGSFFVLWLDFRSWREALGLEIQLILGIVLLVGLMGLVGVPFSILNISMVPAVLAGGIDMGVHVRHRQLESGESGLRAARFVAQAVNLGALTSIVGFGSLFFAEAGMLKGIAWIAVLGQLSMYLICMFIWPVLRAPGYFVRRRG